MERAFPKLPPFIPKVRVRVDSAFCDRGIIEFIEGKAAFYALVVRFT
jgi:hypothetical protein